LEYNETVHQLFIDFRKAYDSVRREILHNILIDFWMPMKVVRLIKMCLNETCSKVHIGKHLPDNFPIQNGLKQGDALLPQLFNYSLEHSIRNGGTRYRSWLRFCATSRNVWDWIPDEVTGFLN
jgi:hypothetical protein